MTRLLLFISSLWLCATLVACNLNANSAGQISDRIGKLANDPSTTALDLPKLTSFGWDTLHLFPAGTTREALCQFMNAGRNICGRLVRYEAVPVDHLALLFTLGGNLTHLELHALSNGVFDLEAQRTRLSRADCVFTVRHTAAVGGQPTALLVPR